MARRPQRQRRRRGGRRGRPLKGLTVGSALALSTLADGSIILGDVMTFGEDFFITSFVSELALRNQTPGQGPVQVGWAHGDLSTGEIIEYLDANLTDPDDIVTAEHNRRPVRRIGKFPSIAADEVLVNGRPLKTRIMKTVGDGHTFTIWARNQTGAALAGGAFLEIQGTVFGRWLR